MTGDVEIAQWLEHSLLFQRIPVQILTPILESPRQLLLLFQEI